jgi:hypothetical protein
MIIKNLKEAGYDFSKIPANLIKSIDVLDRNILLSENGTNQKLELLDFLIFECLEKTDPNNELIMEERSKVDFSLKSNSNNSFNTKGLVDLSGDQQEQLVTAELIDNIAPAKKFRKGGLVDSESKFKIGFRNPFFPPLNTVFGRSREIVLPSGEKHTSKFAIVELSSILASHNETSFTDTVGYPTSKNGRNINDRNYAGDKHAQLKVYSIAQKLEPSLIISTSVDPEGPPIISKDGIVVSGNNRIMSLKLALSEFPKNYKDYLIALKEELLAGGYGIVKMTGIKNPVLVRIDEDFQAYTTENMNQYNVDSKKSESQIDRSIRVSQQLLENEYCQTALIELISTQETVSELYNSKSDVLRFQKILLDCKLITGNELPKYFADNSLSALGINLFMVILSGLILDPTTLEISQSEGIKSITKKVVNATIPSVKNKNLKIGSLNKEINQALLIEYKMKSSGFTSIIKWMNQPELFGENPDLNFKSAVISYWYSLRDSDFKNQLIKYNASMSENQEAGMFGDPMSPDEVFYRIFLETLPSDVQLLILKRFKPELYLLEQNILDLETSMDSYDPETQQLIKEAIENEKNQRYLLI